MPGQPGQLQFTINANGGTDIIVAGAVIQTVNADGTVTFPTAVTDALTLAVTGRLTGSGGIAGLSPVTVQSISGDGAITVPTIAQGIAVAVLSKGSAAAITLADAVVADIGKQIIVISTSAFAHVITAATGGFNAKGSSGTATLVTPFTARALWLLAVAAGNWLTAGGGSITSGGFWTIA